MNVNRTFAAALTLIAIATISADASAQRSWRYDNDRWRPLPTRASRNLEFLVNQSERESNAFRAWFERNYDRRRLGREHDNRWLKNEIQDMDEAMERLRARVDDRRPGVGREQLEDALTHARRIDREIYRDGDTRFTVREWSDLRRTLNDLARVYGIRGV